jgi:predicted O-methyltransferase YrrM
MSDAAAWRQVDDYLVGALQPANPALDAALAASAEAGLPAINVAPNQGKMLMLLAQAAGARRILEIGTLGGYSTIWLARALPPEGRLISLEYDPRHAEVARANLERAGVAERCEVRVGRALDLLPAVEGPFEFVFIDADKPSNPDYFAWAVRLARPGGLIVIDNVVRSGGVADADSAEPAIQGTRRMFEAIAAEPRADACAVQTVGSKGWDGFCLVRVKA